MILLETQYWSLVEIPRQEKAETVPAFVLRACAIMEKTQKSGEGVKTSSKLAEEAADRRERIERLNGDENIFKYRIYFSFFLKEFLAAKQTMNTWSNKIA